MRLIGQCEEMIATLKDTDERVSSVSLDVSPIAEKLSQQVPSHRDLDYKIHYKIQHGKRVLENGDVSDLASNKANVVELGFENWSIFCEGWNTIDFLLDFQFCDRDHTKKGENVGGSYKKKGGNQAFSFFL